MRIKEAAAEMRRSCNVLELLLECVDVYVTESQRVCIALLAESCAAGCGWSRLTVPLHSKEGNHLSASVRVQVDGVPMPSRR